MKLKPKHKVQTINKNHQIFKSSSKSRPQFIRISSNGGPHRHLAIAAGHQADAAAALARQGQHCICQQAAGVEAQSQVEVLGRSP